MGINPTRGQPHDPPPPDNDTLGDAVLEDINTEDINTNTITFLGKISRLYNKVPLKNKADNTDDNTDTDIVDTDIDMTTKDADDNSHPYNTYTNTPSPDLNKTTLANTKTTIPTSDSDDEYMSFTNNSRDNDDDAEMTTSNTDYYTDDNRKALRDNEAITTNHKDYNDTDNKKHPTKSHNHNNSTSKDRNKTKKIMTTTLPATTIPTRPRSPAIPTIYITPTKNDISYEKANGSSTQKLSPATTHHNPLRHNPTESTSQAPTKTTPLHLPVP